MNSHILVIDDEESLRFTLESFLTDEGYVVSTAASFPEAEELLKHSLFDLVFLDIQLGRHSGIDLLKLIREKFVHCPVVMITGAPEVSTAAEAVREGAFDYIPKPIRQETLLRVAKMAIKHKAVVDQREQLRAHLEAIFGSVRDGIMLVDQRRGILEANHALINLFALPKGVVGMSLEQLPKNIRDTFVDIVEKTMLTNQPVVSQRLEVKDPSQKQCILNISTAPCHGDTGNPMGVAEASQPLQPLTEEFFHVLCADSHDLTFSLRFIIHEADKEKHITTHLDPVKEPLTGSGQPLKVPSHFFYFIQLPIVIIISFDLELNSVSVISELSPGKRFEQIQGLRDVALLQGRGRYPYDHRRSITIVKGKPLGNSGVPWRQMFSFHQVS